MRQCGQQRVEQEQQSGHEEEEERKVQTSLGRRTWDMLRGLEAETMRSSLAKNRFVTVRNVR